MDTPRERIKRTIFVKVDHTLYHPDHPSIEAAADVILAVLTPHEIRMIESRINLALDGL